MKILKVPVHIQLTLLSLGNVSSKKKHMKTISMSARESAKRAGAVKKTPSWLRCVFAKYAPIRGPNRNPKENAMPIRA